MKVLMVNTPNSLQFQGGDLVQLRKTAEALRQMGVEVGESFDREPNPSGYDIVHIFNSRTLHVTPDQIRHMKWFGIPIVMSPIYLNPAFALWGTRIVQNIFSSPRTPEEMAKLLEDFRSYKLKVRQSENTIFHAEWQNRAQPDYDKQQIDMLKDIDHLLPNSMLEMNSLVKTLRVCDMPFTVVPYACDPLVFLDPDPAPFVQKYGLKDFVVQAGRVENPKNQLMTLMGLRDAGIPIVFIGGSLDQRYMEWCKEYGGKDLHIIPHLPPHELAAGYAAAKVHVLASWVETCGLVSMEAALGNCSVVASIAGYELEYYRDLAYYCDPTDPQTIRKAVLTAYENYDKDATRRLRLKQLILSEYTWERAAELTYKAYCKVLAKR